MIGIMQEDCWRNERSWRGKGDSRRHLSMVLTLNNNTWYKQAKKIVVELGYQLLPAQGILSLFHIKKKDF